MAGQLPASEWRGGTLIDFFMIECSGWLKRNVCEMVCGCSSTRNDSIARGFMSVVRNVTCTANCTLSHTNNNKDKQDKHTTANKTCDTDDNNYNFTAELQVL